MCIRDRVSKFVYKLVRTRISFKCLLLTRSIMLLNKNVKTFITLKLFPERASSRFIGLIQSFRSSYPDPISRFPNTNSILHPKISAPGTLLSTVTLICTRYPNVFHPLQLFPFLLPYSLRNGSMVMAKKILFEIIADSDCTTLKT